MSVRHLVTAVTAALLGGVGLAAPAAHASARPVAAGVYDLSAGRVGAIVAALVGLLGLAVGVRALVRSARAGSGRNGAAVAVAAGVFGMALGGLVAATADGGLGTGNGLGGAYVALLVGLAGTVSGGLALARSRRVG
ncbi:DUF6223 family protein [Actinomadura kijaniata]|uniref:DUF6223 family protein n=1 Tax=Actinomadura kijaniata TaxID=46161 RepID=UPI003F1AA92A